MTSLNCPWCSYSNRPASRYCGDCGRALSFTIACASCGAINPDGAAFCDACGVRFAGAASIAPPAAQSTAPATFAVRPHESPVQHFAREIPHAGPPAPTAPSQPSPPALPDDKKRFSIDQFVNKRAAGLLTATSAALTAIVVFSLLLRLVSLTTAPPNITADEADNLQVVYHIQAGTGPGFFGFDWKPSPAFSMYIVTGFMNIFGNSIIAMRLPSVILSVVALVVFYHLARQAVSRPAALAATVLLSTSLWYLHFSRSGWENIHIGLYGLMATLCLAHALRSGNLLLFAAAGVFAALGLYGYLSGMMIVAGLIAYFPFAIAIYRKRWGRVTAGYAVILVVCAVLFFPQIQKSFDDWNGYTKRQRAVLVVDREGGYMGETALPAILADQAMRSFKGFFLMDTQIQGIGLNARYISPGRGALDIFTAIIFWTGLIASFWKLRNTALWWVMFLIMVFPVQILAAGTPDLARGVGSAPFFFLFVALGLDFLFRAIENRNTWSKAGAVFAVALIAIFNITGYFNWTGSEASQRARHPAVEVAEFEVWQSLQIAEAEAGRFGFNVNQWHELRSRYIQ